ncbi:MAG: DALR domain-containing protein, partial [Phycisphaerae bacterium]
LRKAADVASVPPNRTSHSTVASGLRAGRDSATTATSHEYSKRTADATPSPLTAPITAPTETIRTALTDFRTRFASAMNDDFNTAAAIASLFEVTRQTNQWIADGANREDLAAASTLLDDITQNALGLHWPTPSETGNADGVIQILADLRNQARKDKNFALSDQIRNRLTEIDIELRDTPDGTKW